MSLGFKITGICVRCFCPQKRATCDLTVVASFSQTRPPIEYGHHCSGPKIKVEVGDLA